MWNRIMHGLPAGQLSFLLRAASDTLPTPLNLKRWRYRVDATCHLCSSPSPTTLHILNGCPQALVRFTWRHNSVLLKLVSSLKPLLSPEERFHADLAGYRVSDNPQSTVPQEIIVTTARPDIVVIKDKHILLIELTIPFNTPKSIANAHRWKEGKDNYNMLLDDLEARGFTSTFLAIEIGSLGHSLPSIQKALLVHFPSLTKPGARKLLDEAGKLAFSVSHMIFLARREVCWNLDRRLLK